MKCDCCRVLYTQHEGFDRGLCGDCDAVRCDLTPRACEEEVYSELLGKGSWPTREEAVERIFQGLKKANEDQLMQLDAKGWSATALMSMPEERLRKHAENLVRLVLGEAVVTTDAEAR